MSNFSIQSLILALELQKCYVIWSFWTQTALLETRLNSMKNLDYSLKRKYLHRNYKTLLQQNVKAQLLSRSRKSSMDMLSKNISENSNIITLFYLGITDILAFKLNRMILKSRKMKLQNILCIIWIETQVKHQTKLIPFLCKVHREVRKYHRDFIY